jgi:CRP/FNR family transcriptional regulator, cyclic AMP receptor protein
MTSPALMTPLLRKLVERGVEKRFRKGSIIIHEGDAGDTIYIVLTGQLRAFSESADGKAPKEITYGTYGAGDYVGEMSLDGGARSASVEATQATTCAVINRETLRQFIAAEPDFAFELMARIIRRARMATLSAKKLALFDTYARLADALMQLAEPEDTAGVRYLPKGTTHAQLAAHIGASREMVSRLLKDLERGSYVQMDGRRIGVGKALPKGW